MNGIHLFHNIFNQFYFNSIFSEFSKYQTMKYWLSHLPLEVWVDCYRYPWISREQMGQIVDLIGNHKYGEYLQFYLHDWGKRKLDYLYFDKKGLYKYVPYRHRPLYLDFPQTPMPANIKSFDFILIDDEHFDRQTIDFLRRIQALLTNVKLEFSDETHNMENLRIILTNIVPLLDGNHTVCCNVRALPTVEQCFGDKLAQINEMELYIDVNADMDEALRQATVHFLRDWLTTPSTGPKLCELKQFDDNGWFSEHIIATIREEFLAAKSPRTFALIFSSIFPMGWAFAEFHLQNGIGEELHGVWNGDEDVQITRHSANCDQQMQEWIKQNQSKRQSQIAIQSPTIGSIDALDAPPPENVVDVDDQPSTSKKARIS